MKRYRVTPPVLMTGGVTHPTSARAGNGAGGILSYHGIACICSAAISCGGVESFPSLARGSAASISRWLFRLAGELLARTSGDGRFVCGVACATCPGIVRGKEEDAPDVVHHR